METMETTGSPVDHPGTAEYDVAVIGGGQSGLAVGWFLARAGLRFVILDQASAVGEAWRARWDALRLFTPRRFDSLPGLAFPGDPETYPTKDEAAAYLQTYAATFGLPVWLGQRVRSVAQDGRGRFVVRTDSDTVVADQVVAASGPFHTPHVPEVASGLEPGVVQLHSSAYRYGDDVPDGTVVVVGGGNSGFQIAEDLAGRRHVVLAVGERLTPLPQRVLSRDIFWWIRRLRVWRVPVDSRLGRLLSAHDVLIGTGRRRVRRCGVQIRPRVVRCEGRRLGFADGTHVDADAVIWATGFRPDYEWLHLPVLDARGRPVHHRGVTAVPGAYFVGLLWQHTIGSATLGGVSDDAEYIARLVCSRSGQRVSDDNGRTR